MHTDERHVQHGQDRGKSSAAHARAPPIDLWDWQAWNWRQLYPLIYLWLYCINETLFLVCFAHGILNAFLITRWGRLCREFRMCGRIIYRAVSSWSNIIEVLYKSIATTLPLGMEWDVFSINKWAIFSWCLVNFACHVLIWQPVKSVCLVVIFICTECVFSKYDSQCDLVLDTEKHWMVRISLLTEIIYFGGGCSQNGSALGVRRDLK